MKKPRNIIAGIYKKYTKLSNNLAVQYAQTLGCYCDLYYPVRCPKRKSHNYQNINLFEPHELPVYKECPDVENYLFYIPELMQKESMNSIADQFDAFALMTTGSLKKPFIECSPDEELPDYTKVVIKLDTSTVSYFVDVKHVINGAGGHMLMRQYLSPLTKDNYIVEGKYDEIPGTANVTNGINNRTNGAVGGNLN